MPIEKRVDALVEYSLYQRVVDPVTCLQLAEEAFKLSEQSGYEKGTGISLVQLGFQHWHLSQIDKGLEEVEEGLSIIKKAQANDFIADTNMIKAMIIWSKGDYERSFNIIYNTLKELEEIGVDEGVPWMYWCLGVFYYDLKDYTKSIENYEKALTLYERWEKPDPGCKCYSLVGLGSVYKAKGDFNQAIDYLNQGMEMSAKYERWIEQARAHFELGAIFKLQGDYERARTELELSYAMRKEHNTKPGMVSSLLELSDIHLHRGSDDEALKLLTEALGYALETNTKPKIYQCHERLSALWKKKGDYKKAFEHMENYYRIKSEVAGDEANNMLKDLETKYATEKAEKEKEIERLKNVELKKANEVIAEKNKE
ncbi:MAG TPA: hypothetical protein DCX54_13025, partial [Flavobacteriales bacterium]|nr:hypothetical protein [Flavobacteriales bacterium]